MFDVLFVFYQRADGQRSRFAGGGWKGGGDESQTSSVSDAAKTNPPHRTHSVCWEAACFRDGNPCLSLVRVYAAVRGYKPATAAQPTAQPAMTRAAFIAFVLLAMVSVAHAGGSRGKGGSGKGGSYHGGTGKTGKTGNPWAQATWEGTWEDTEGTGWEDFRWGGDLSCVLRSLRRSGFAIVFQTL